MQVIALRWLINEQLLKSVKFIKFSKSISKEGAMKQVILLVVFLIASNLLIAEEKINLMTEILPPFQYYDEEKVLTGISIEIIDGIKTKIKSNDPIKVVPWSRGLKIVKKKGNSALDRKSVV
mgnify:FL=1